MKTNKKILIPITVVILLDQIIKIILNNLLIYGQSINIIKGFFRITLLHNQGAAFSILLNERIFLILISFICLYLIYLFFIKNKILNKKQIILYGMLIGGIIGNLMDRIIYGYVIDYLDFLNFPVFNLADSCIVISVILILVGGKNDSK